MFTMRHNFGWTHEEMGDMTPYEFEVYAILLQQRLKEEEERKRQNAH